jgi:hypothetical protein
LHKCTGAFESPDDTAHALRETPTCSCIDADIWPRVSGSSAPVLPASECGCGDSTCGAQWRFAVHSCMCHMGGSLERNGTTDRHWAQDCHELLIRCVRTRHSRNKARPDHSMSSAMANRANAKLRMTVHCKAAGLAIASAKPPARRCSRATVTCPGCVDRGCTAAAAGAQAKPCKNMSRLEIMACVSIQTVIPDAAAKATSAPADPRSGPDDSISGSCRSHALGTTETKPLAGSNSHSTVVRFLVQSQPCCRAGS